MVRRRAALQQRTAVLRLSHRRLPVPAARVGGCQREELVPDVWMVVE
jgi:hypothetical protein